MEYNAERLAFKLSRIIAEHIQLETLGPMVLGTLCQSIGVAKAALILFEEHQVRDIIRIGFKEGELQDHWFDGLMHYMMEAGARPFTAEQIEEGGIKNSFRQFGLSVSVPIRVENNEVAVLLLGEKDDRSAYSEKDLVTLNILAGDIGAALQNAVAYKKLKRFSEELERQVEKRTEELIEAQNRELAKAKEVAKLKDEFVFIATHELRTPVTIIRGFMEIVSAGLAKFPADVRKSLTAMNIASDHLNQLIDDLLEVARSEGGSLKLNLAPHEAGTIIQFAIDEMKKMAEEKKIAIKTNLKNYPPVICDPSKLVEVVQNLMSNAIKYNKDNGEVEVNAVAAGDFLVVEVRDTGYGIPKDQRDKIFQKFARAVTPETQEIKGTGLGLFLVRMLVEKMGGEVTFSSVENKGSTFAFTLPFAKVS